MCRISVVALYLQFTQAIAVAMVQRVSSPVHAIILLTVYSGHSCSNGAGFLLQYMLSFYSQFTLGIAVAMVQGFSSSTCYPVTQFTLGIAL